MSLNNKSLTTNIIKKTQTKSIFKESVFTIVRNYKKTRDPSTYDPVIKYLKQNPPPPKLCCHFLSQLRDAIPLLDRDTELLVLDTLRIPWQYGDEDVQTHFYNFILSLVTGHSYFVSPILEVLFKQLKPEITENTDEELRLNPFEWSKTQHTLNTKNVQLIQTILKHVPLCETLLVKIARSTCPYYKQHVYVHVTFTYNMLLLGRLIPHLRAKFLEILISNITKLDLNSPRRDLDEDSDDESDNGSEDLFSMECETEVASPPSRAASAMSHPIGHSLDLVMSLVFRYTHFVAHGGGDLRQILHGGGGPFVVRGCTAGSAKTQVVDAAEAEVTNDGCGCGGKSHDLRAVKELYVDLKRIFTGLVLPTHAVSHVQYVLFHALSLRPSLLSDFLDALRALFESSACVSLEEKKASLAYLGSLLVRGKFVRFTHVHSCLEILRNWCKVYLQTQLSRENMFEDMKLHRQFYYACQIIFYVFTFNFKEYTQSKSRLKMAQSLQLNELISCPLNPLRFCSQAITFNFAAITYHYQLAYCYTVMENNCRLFLPIAMQDSYGVFQAQSNTLDMYFPFDPYMLKKSETYIGEHYREFEGLPEEILCHSSLLGRRKRAEGRCGLPMEDEDEEEEEDPSWSSPPLAIKFSYEMSPGFKNV